MARFGLLVHLSPDSLIGLRQQDKLVTWTVSSPAPKYWSTTDYLDKGFWTEGQGPILEVTGTWGQRECMASGSPEVKTLYWGHSRKLRSKLCFGKEGVQEKKGPEVCVWGWMMHDVCVWGVCSSECHVLCQCVLSESFVCVSLRAVENARLTTACRVASTLLVVVWVSPFSSTSVHDNSRWISGLVSMCSFRTRFSG